MARTPERILRARRKANKLAKSLKAAGFDVSDGAPMGQVAGNGPQPAQRKVITVMGHKYEAKDGGGFGPVTEKPKRKCRCKGCGVARAKGLTTPVVDVEGKHVGNLTPPPTKTCSGIHCTCSLPHPNQARGDIHFEIHAIPFHVLQEAFRKPGVRAVPQLVAYGSNGAETHFKRQTLTGLYALWLADRFKLTDSGGLLNDYAMHALVKLAAHTMGDLSRCLFEIEGGDRELCEDIKHQTDAKDRLIAGSDWNRDGNTAVCLKGSRHWNRLRPALLSRALRHHTTLSEIGMMPPGLELDLGTFTVTLDAKGKPMRRGDVCHNKVVTVSYHDVLGKLTARPDNRV